MKTWRSNDLADIRRALEALPETCRYHGDKLWRGGQFYDGACCETGKPSLYRHQAEDALKRLQGAEGDL